MMLNKKISRISSSIPSILRSASRYLSSQAIQDYSFTNLVDMQINSCKLNSSGKFLGTKNGNNFDFITYKDFAEEINKFRGVLSLHRVGVNDKIALISNNRLEWAVSYYAANSLGAQIVPMYEAQTEKDWKYIIEDSEAKVVLVATDKIFNKTSGYIENFGKVHSVLCFDSSEDYLHSYKRWMKNIKPEQIPKPLIPSPDDLTTIIYTSGTTGNPKGVELSHRNIVANIKGLKELWGEELKLRQTSVCFLPWAHVFGMTVDLHALLAHGSCAALASRESILETIEIIKPSAMSSVPLLFNKVYDGVKGKFATESPAKQKIIQAAFDVARERNHKKEYGESVSQWLEMKYKLADKVVFAKIREKLGGNLRYLGSGGAAVSRPVLEFFEDIGVPICEGYGLTETSPVITSSIPNWNDRRLGCVGRALDGVKLRITDPETLEEVKSGEEGEICCSGDSVMVGYRNNPEANKEVFFYVNGVRYFRTGDLGVLVDNKFLKITGRIKELYKLENGKYIVPAPLEDIIARSLFIAQAYIFGVNMPYNVGLIVPEYTELWKWAEKHGLPTFDHTNKENTKAIENFFNDERVLKLYTSEVDQACSTMKGYERMQAWAIITEPFTQENQMLTPKMSLRRRNVHRAYDHLIKGLYDGSVGHKKAFKNGKK